MRYTPALGREICARLAAGESQHALAREAGMPSRRTFRDWALRDPGFGAAFERAKLAGRLARIAATRAADRERVWRSDLYRQRRKAVAGGEAGARRGRGGSVSMLTPALAEEICARIAAGEPAVRICAEDRMPCVSTLYGWVRRNEAFREQYETARGLASDLYFDLCLDVALEATEDTVRADRLRITTFTRWAAQVEPKKYGLRRMLGPGVEAAGREDFGPQPFAIEVVDFVGRGGAS